MAAGGSRQGCKDGCSSVCLEQRWDHNTRSHPESSAVTAELGKPMPGLIASWETDDHVGINGRFSHRRETPRSLMQCSALHSVFMNGLEEGAKREAKACWGYRLFWQERWGLTEELQKNPMRLSNREIKHQMKFSANKVAHRKKKILILHVKWCAPNWY